MMQSHPRRAGYPRVRNLPHAALRAIAPVVETLEARRLLCTLGLDSTHLEPFADFSFDPGEYLELNLPDAGLIDVPSEEVGRSALTMDAADMTATPPVSAPVGGLSGKVAYMNAGHGWTYNGTSWVTQRPEYQEMVEDLTTQDQMTFYAQYMLNAGATVVPTRPLGHQLNEVIVDNNDAGFSIQSGSWSTNSASSTYWSNTNGTDTGNRYRFANVSATETAVARFTPNIAAAGFYPVYAWWNNGSNRPTDATYRINSAGGSEEVKVNQRFTGKGWVYLGMYYFDAGTGGNVEVSNKASNGTSVIADAVRFGNGMGTWAGDGTGPISGKPREDELSLYWLYLSRGWTGSGSRVSTTVVDGGNSADSTAGIVAPPRWISYMNDETQGSSVDRLHLSFHSNGSTGAADASARGTLALIHSSSPTMNQAWWADVIAEEVEEDMQALPAGTLEHTWWSRTNTLSGAYGEISNASLNAYNSSTATIPSEMSATLLEVLFHDNLEDSQLMRDPKVRDWTARASYQAAVKYFNNFAGSSATMLPDPPTASRATTNAAGDVILNWGAPGTGAANGGAGAAAGYKILYGANGYSWSGQVTVGAVTSYTFPAGTLPAGEMTYFKILATNAGGESMQRDVVAAKAQAARRAPILIVNGFDRFDRTTNDTIPWSGNNGVTERVRWRYQNTRDYVVQFAEAVEAYNPALGVETVQNEQVISGAVNLANYHSVLWISGEESVVDQSFNSTERSLLTTYLNNGGKLFVSGAEIGWHLDQSGADPAFYNNLLRADFVSDDANSYTTSGVAGSIFAGLTAIVFDNGADALPSGSFNTYDVDTPDVITPINGSTAALTYSTGGTAAVQFSSGNTRVVTMGFPFETIVSATKRNQVMSGVLGYFGVNSTLSSATPGTPDLLASSDTGSSSTDNRTNRNNSSAGTTLQFNVSGTIPGATVTLYSGTTSLGSAVATGTTTTVTTSGTFPLSGTVTITAKQTESGGVESAASPGLTIVVDTAAPAAPSPLTASGSPTSVSLDWPDSAATDLWGYNVYRSTTSGSGYLKINGAVVGNSDYVDNSAATNTTYYYVVRAIDTAGNESPNSPQASASTAPLVSATPGTPDLDAGSDTGRSSSDNVTRRNNANAGSTLQFLVSGTVVGATVTLYNEDGTAIGSAVASSSSTLITTNGTTALLDGVRNITAKQTETGKTASAASSALTVTIDTAAPSATLGTQTPARGATVLDFTVTYADSPAGVDSLTFDGSDILVTGPNGYSVGATVQNIAGDVVTYRIAAPGGTWDANDDGAYTITQNANQVGDIAGNMRSAGTVGTISADLPFAWVDANVLKVQYLTAGNTVSMSTSGSNVNLVQGTKNVSRNVADFTSVQIAGTAGDDTLVFNGTMSEPISFNGGAGADLIQIIGGTFTFTTDAGLTTQNLAVQVSAGGNAVFNATQHLADLTVNGSAVLTEGNAKVIVTRNLAVAGRLDLTDNDLIWDYTGASPIGAYNSSIESYTGVQGMVASGYNSGDWLGNGLVTTLQKALTKTTLGVGEAADVLFLAPNETGMYGDETVDATAIIVKYTWMGDANLDGVINADDYSAIDTNYRSLSSPRSFSAGDFNYDGVIDADDYSWIDTLYRSHDEEL